MKRGKGEDGSKSIDRISELPQCILQRILYFMSQEDAVRTSVLSKSWREIWCTRPNLDLSDATFKGNNGEFISVLENTLRRYCEQRLSLDECSLSCTSFDSTSVSLIEKWIPLITSAGVKNFRLSIVPAHFGHVKLPSVVFETESLRDLHVERFILDQKAIEKTVLFKHLKKLRLEQVCIHDRIFQKIISSCPLIETMFLKSCNTIRSIKASNLRRLKDFYFSSWSDEEDCSIEIYPTSIETIQIESGNILLHQGSNFLNLTSLFLDHVTLSSLDHFSSCKFPSLENVAILYCNGLEESLEESHLHIDAPNISTFGYHGLLIPSISFATTSTEWSSCLYLLMRSDPSFWLLKLHKLLDSLRQSEISVTIHQFRMNDEDIFQENLDLVQDIKGGNKPAVPLEDLKLQGDLSYFSPLLNGLFCICRPRKIGAINYMNAESVLKNLMQGENGNYQDQLRQLWLPDLEEVSLEIYDKNRREWDPTSLSDLPDYEVGKRISTRFALKWRESL
ncbi:PREDICTED: F-box/LRR-repeat protein 13-like [Erythranthe guttata]|uniref:F-box/LRR-repeat protein 13-like n=1 Tax=Erythranthe guttata TaxID=4155 RepID=UPI00064D7AD3|nr:PREDICTED: F-box/LRR-repeat protein 13-like [Erythranthe guttata]|eukprot:XP_012833381.1 PREDICTED: F-box/LRR-repeat protein 13-like [Erythranthe guttata]